MTAEKRTAVGIDVGLGRETAPRELHDRPFCMLVIGDFAGTAARKPLGERRAVRFDRDDVDAALARVAPALGSLRFRTLDDFHPDRLFATVPAFAALRDLRARLLDPRSFAAAARDLTGADEPPAPAAPAAGGGSLLDRMLAESAGPAPAAAPGSLPLTRDDLAAFVRQAVRRHLVADPDPRQAELVQGVDEAVAAQLRALLHDPAFRALEAAWRTVDRLARRIDTDASLRLYLMDVSAAELDAALDDAPAGSAETLARALAEAGLRLPDDAFWSCLLVLCELGGEERDHARLARLALIAGALGAPAFVDASPGIAGLETWAELPPPRTWAPRPSPALEALRASPAAAWICLAAPRVLLREPYGAEGEPVESFRFEEVSEAAGHEEYAWGGGAAACALLLAQAFSLHGWRLRPGAVAELDGLPLPTRRRDGESELVPCAETLMTEDAAERLLELGITPIATLRGTDTVRVVRFQSIASPPTALAGPWQAA